MKMICGKINCIGGTQKDFDNYGKEVSKLCPFPDGVNRVITMKANEWAVFEKHFTIGSPGYFRAMRTILREAPLFDTAREWPLEWVIQYIFREVIINSGRKHEYGTSYPANQYKRKSLDS